MSSATDSAGQPSIALEVALEVPREVSKAAKPSSRIRPWLVRVLIVLLAVCWLAIIAVAWGAAEAEASEASPRADDEYNFNWLDPDKKIYVLQNRRYTKAMRPMVSVMGGTGFSNPYRTTVSVEPRASFYFTEALGVELRFNYNFNFTNNFARALAVASPSTMPQIREVRMEYGAQLTWVPWYAKINVFNQILYFDWYFNAGGGIVSTAVDTRTSVSQPSDYVIQNLPGLFLSTGHLYHVGHTFLVRLDFTGSFYSAPINGTSGESSIYSNYGIGAGIGAMF